MRGRAHLRPVPSAVAGVHYTVTGDAADGVPVAVLLHGFADNLATWNRVVPAIATSHRVIAIDLPGFGQSVRPWRAPLLEGYVDVVREVLDAEGVAGPVSLIGNSMGAAVATLFARRFPMCTDRVVLVDMPGLCGVPRIWDLAMSRPAEFGLRTALRMVGDTPARVGLGWAYGRIAAARPRLLDPFAREGFSTPYALPGSVPALLPLGRALLADLRTIRLGTAVAELRAPALLVFGARDLLTPARVLRRVGRPGGAVVLPGCGHCPQIDQPEALLTQVLPFLRESAAQSGSLPPARTA